MLRPPGAYYRIDTRSITDMQAALNQSNPIARHSGGANFVLGLSSSKLATFNAGRRISQMWRISRNGHPAKTNTTATLDFAVNAGAGTAAKLAQIVVSAVADGNIGPATQEKLNALDEAVFVTKYALAKVARYAQICNKDRSQTKFLLGWINRTIGGLT